MKNSKFTFKDEPDQLTIKVDGEISATTEFPKIMLKSNQTKILLQLDDAGYVNSSGIQGWILWLNELQKSAATAQFYIQMLPSNFARLSYHIRDFLPRKAKVESFVAPYYCQNCNKNFDVIFKRGLNWKDTWTAAEIIQQISTANCAGCGASADIDTAPEAYGNF